MPLAGTGLVLQVTGIVAPVDGRRAILDSRSGGRRARAGPAVTRRAVLARRRVRVRCPGRCAAESVRCHQHPGDWTFPLALDNLTATQANRLALDLPAALSTAGQLTFTSGTTANVSLSSGALTLVGEFAAQEGAVGNLLNLMSVSLAVVGAAVVLLVAWLMAEKRREEFAVLRARGASRRQLAGVASAGSAVAALPGAAAGVVVAVG